MPKKNQHDNAEQARPPLFDGEGNLAEESRKIVRVGDLIDTAYALRGEMSELNRKIKQLKEQQAEIYVQIVEELGKLGLEKGSGHTANCVVGERLYTGVEDKKKFYEWAIENSRWECVKADLNQKGVKELIDETNEAPPGVRFHTEKTVTSLTKR